MNRVVVTGVGVLAPNAHGADAFAAALRGMKSGIRRHERLAELGFSCQVGGIPEGVDELRHAYLREDELLAMNPNMVYAAIAAIDAWEHAGLRRPAPDDPPDWGAGAILGTGIGGIDTIAEQLAPKVDAGKVELSGGYACDLAIEDGTTPAGEAYQAVQRNIRGNHVALVDHARAGPDARISDGGNACFADCENATVILNLSDANEENPVSKKITLDGLQVDLSDAAAVEVAINKLQGQLADAMKAKDAATASAGTVSRSVRSARKRRRRRWWRARRRRRRRNARAWAAGGR